MAYYYLDQPFHTGMVLDRLSAAGYTQFVALDIGGGESSAYLYEYKNLQWQLRKLKFDDKDSPTIPTYISYSGGQVRIGRQADPLRFISRFKLPPDKWEKTKPDGSHTAKELLRDYIAQFWKRVLHWTPELRRSAEDGRLMLVAGCPASGEWLASAGDYEQLIREATGCPGVSVVSEAVAAMVHEVFNGDLDLGRGVVIYDVGSVTVDAVYLCLGRKLISKSLPLGGSQIDQGMLLRILEGSGLSREDIPYDQWQYILAQVRAIKEDYYPGKCVRERNIYLLKTDGTSELTIRKPEKISETGGTGAGRDVWLPGPPDRVLQVRMDDAFMEKVLKEDKNLVDYPDQTWLEVLEDLFRDVRTRIGDRPCQTVILTGGTSHIPEILDLAKAVYDGKASRVIQSEEPSAAVAQGLCMAKGRESRALQDLVKDQSQAEGCSQTQTALNQAAAARQAQILENVFSDFKSQVYRSVSEHIRALAPSGTDDAPMPTVAKFAKQVRDAALQDNRLSGRDLEEALLEKYRDAAKSSAAGLSKEIYGKELQVTLDAQINNATTIDKAYLNALDFDLLIRIGFLNEEFLTNCGCFYFPLSGLLAVLPIEPLPEPISDALDIDLSDRDLADESVPMRHFLRYSSRMIKHEEAFLGTLKSISAKSRTRLNRKSLDRLLGKGTDYEDFELLFNLRAVRKNKKTPEFFDDCLKRTSNIEGFFNAQIRDLFEIALGQLLFQVFEEPADLYDKERL